MCTPVEDMVIVAKIQRLNNLLVCAENGPMLIIIQYDQINKGVFDIETSGKIVHKDSGALLSPGSMIKLRILSKKFLVYDNNIKVLGYIEDFAQQDEIDICYHNHHEAPTGTLRNKLQDPRFSILKAKPIYEP